MSEQAAKTPDHVALRSFTTTLTYRELDRRSGALARHLQDRGVRPESQVGLLAVPSVWTIVAELAILKAGGAFVPIDQHSPPLRQRRMIENGIELFVALPDTGFVDPAVPSVDPTSVEPGQPREPALSPLNAAYVMYTSGSTGEPNGAVNTHAALLSSTLARMAVYPDPVHSYLLLSPLFFDSSLAGIYWALATGGEVVLMPGSPARDPGAVLRTARQAQASHLLALPSLYGPLLSFAQPHDFASLRVVIVAGEPCSATLIASHRVALPHTELYVEWGVTEASVWSSVFRAAEPMDNPLGRPIPDTSIGVTDDQLHAVPDGATGELCIGGPGLARGYVANARLTARRFVPDPARAGCARRYRTGDIGRRADDGQLQFVGRTDNQVKLRGIRIELEEPEHAIRSHPQVLDCVVAAVRDSEGNAQSLAAVVVPRDPQQVWPSQLHGFLLARLPRHLIPARVVMVEHLPTLGNGKVDRGRLAELLTLGTDHAEIAAEPGVDALAVFVAEVWRDVLGVSGMSVDDDFFELGGQSLSALRIVARVRAELQISLPADAVFQAPTIRDFVALLEGESRESG